MKPRSLKTCRTALWVTLMILCGEPVGADDAGTQSPFAHGAGGRAAALGGAYVALADDPSSLVWNAAGLARVQRTTFELGYARLEAGVGRNIALLSVPSWRWGTIALAVQHLGVDGIDQRDASNLPIEGGFSSSESEVAIGYGQSFGPALGLGVAGKVQRLSVGASGASSFGLDMGMQFDPAAAAGDRLRVVAPLRLGLTLQNVIRPAMRLVQDEVADPRVVQAGLAWRQPFRGMTTTFAGELERAEGRSLRVHAGAEVQLIDALTLRAGCNEGRLTAGTAFAWSGFAIDYAFEQRDLGAIQRIGLSRAFGASVEQRRQRSIAVQEHAVAERVDRAFQEQRIEQVRAAFERATTARRAHDLDACLEASAMLRALDPEDPRPDTLTAGAYREEAMRLEIVGDKTGALLTYGRALQITPGDSLAQRRQRALQADLDRGADRRASLSREMREAYAALASGDLLQARTGARNACRVAPDDPEAATLLSRIERTLSDRISQHLRAARRGLANGRLSESEGELKSAELLGGDRDSIAALRQNLRAHRTPSPAPTLAPLSSAPTPAQRREADALFRRGLAIAGKQRDGAVRLWEIALGVDPEHVRARDALKREYMLRGMEFYGRGVLAEAERQWARVLELDPSDQRARGYLERAQAEINRTRQISESR